MKQFDHPLDSVFGISNDNDEYDIEKEYNLMEMPKEPLSCIVS